MFGANDLENDNWFFNLLGIGWKKLPQVGIYSIRFKNDEID